MNKKALFTEAHQLARQTITRFGGDYRVTFAAALSCLYKQNKEKGMSKYTEFLNELKQDNEKMLAQAQASDNPRHKKYIEICQDRLAAIEKFDEVIERLPEEWQEYYMVKFPEYDRVDTIVSMIAGTYRAVGVERFYNAVLAAL